MPRSYICPNCERKIGVDHGYPGLVINCPGCEKPFQLPSLELPRAVLDASNMARVACALLAIFGSFVGLHKFAMGRWGWGILYLMLSVLGPFTLFLSTLLVGLMGFLEGIIYLCMSDARFFERYVVGRRGLL